MINQTKREEVIKLLDKSSENVKLEDLFLYDLSPYYIEKQDNSFFSKQLEYQKERDLLNHRRNNISFTSEQKKIYNEIVDKNNNRIIISAPTSFGKTMLVKEYIFNEQPEIIVFIVPTNSLADELIGDFVQIYTDLGYTIYDTVKENSEIQKKSIFIGTQEKFYQIYQDHNIEIDLFIIDEAYKLGDNINGSREVILNRAFIDTTNKAKRTILLLPLVNSIEGVASLNFKILKSEYAPVAKNFTSIIDTDFNSNMIKKISDDKESNLIYFNSPNEAEDFYLKSLNNFKAKNIISNEWVERVETDFHKEWIPINAIRNGIGIHYGPMPKFIQKKVIDLFNKGTIKTVLATSSIIEGVNTPTKNIFITTSKDILGGKENKNVIKFKNLIGRAGRLGIHKVGNVYFMNKHKDVFDKVNIPYTDIDLKIIVENESEVVQINRESEFKSFNSESNQDNGDDTFESNRPKTINSLNESDFGTIPPVILSGILNKHGFTINQVKRLIEYSKRDSIYVFGILKNLIPKVELDSLNIVIDKKNKSIADILEELKKVDKFKNKQNPQLISIIIKMIYNVIPHQIIPALDFVIELNEIYFKYNKKTLFSRENIKEANLKKVLFFNKYIGEDVSKIEESKKVMSKLFEYGIPYFRVRNHINNIVRNVPENFSIYDIKRIIFEDDSMKDLRIYFE
jgi:superfamily II helicase